jgi:hypothetical protein
VEMLHRDEKTVRGRASVMANGAKVKQASSHDLGRYRIVPASAACLVLEKECGAVRVIHIIHVEIAVGGCRFCKPMRTTL